MVIKTVETEEAKKAKREKMQEAAKRQREKRNAAKEVIAKWLDTNPELADDVRDAIRTFVPAERATAQQSIGPRANAITIETIFGEGAADGARVSVGDVFMKTYKGLPEVRKLFKKWTAEGKGEFSFDLQAKEYVLNHRA